MNKKLVFLLFAVVGLFTATAIYSINIGKDNNFNAKTMEKNGHTLVSEWQEYYDAYNADLPKDEMRILKKIKKTALAKDAIWDFYDASKLYINSVGRVNWKGVDEARDEFKSDISRLNIPILNFLYDYDYEGIEEAKKYFSENRELLKKQQHKELYPYSGHLVYSMKTVLSNYIQNDYEFALWLLANNDFPVYKEELKSYLGDSYPNGAYAAYMEANNVPVKSYWKPVERKAALEKVASKYQGKAIGFYAWADILKMDKDFFIGDKGDEKAYKNLYSECKSYESKVSKLNKTEKSLLNNANIVKNIIKTLTSPELSVGVKNGKIVLYFRNLKWANVNVFTNESKTPSFDSKVKNDKNSFYVVDTVFVDYAVKSDGKYTVKAVNKKLSDKFFFDKYSLSIATRRINKGTGVYVTDYKTGKPLSKVDLSLFLKGKKVAEVKDFKLKDGFTQLPSIIVSAINTKAMYNLQASYIDKKGNIHSSKLLSFRPDEDYPREQKNKDYANIYLAQGAYKPGETLSFMGLLFNGNYYKALNAWGAGKKVMVKLYDSENNCIDSQELTTNQFGTVAGEFKIPENLRNGLFSISLNKNDKTLCSNVFRVDNFILPTYYVDFDSQKEFYVPGDEVLVSGVAKSYSGHSLIGAKVEYRVLRGSQPVDNGVLNIGSDGRFEIKFHSDVDSNWAYYQVSVLITDSKGETNEYNTVVRVGEYIYLDTEVLNEVDAELEVPNKDDKYENDGEVLVMDDNLVFVTKAGDYENGLVPMDLKYELKNNQGELVTKGAYKAGEEVKLDISKLGDGLYSLFIVSDSHKAKAKESKSKITVLKMSRGAKELNAPVDYLFSAYNTDLKAGEKFGAYFGASIDSVWAVAELYGANRELLDSRLIHLDSKKGETLQNIEFENKDSYPSSMILQVFYFKNGTFQNFTANFDRPVSNLDMPLSFSAFQDKTNPMTEYTFGLKTLPNVQCLVSVYDKALDAIRSNNWNKVELRPLGANSVDINLSTGNGLTDYELSILGARSRTYGAVPEAVMDMCYNSRSDEGLLTESDVKFAKEVENKVEIRSDFASSLTFQPFLQSDENGNVNFSFKTGGKISTFYVKVFAHNALMQNALLSKEMVVTLPVKLDVTAPTYLYNQDEYNMTLALSSNLNEALSGVLTLEQYAGKDYKGLMPFKKSTIKVEVPAGGNVAEQFNIKADLQKLLKLAGKADENEAVLGLKATFVSKDGKISDGIFLPINVLAARQVIKESRSAVVLDGMNEAQVIKNLRSQFVNGNGNGAERNEISILDMVKEAIPTRVNPRSNNVLDLMDAYYVQLLAKSLGVEVEAQKTADELLSEILNCRNFDGGFAWFEGMNSSPIITASILEKFSKLSKAGLLESPDLSATVEYLDKNQLKGDMPYWCGGLNLYKYIYVRSLYPEVEYVGPKDKDFKKNVQDFLVPKGNRGLQYSILDKVSRLMTLDNLANSNSTLAETWGIKSDKALKESLNADVASLIQYAVEAKNGGKYYPNAVMPFRGLLESEAYAHSLICDLMSRFSELSPECGQIADGIRIWLMVQKETQKWEDSPEFIDAINSVMSGSDAVKATKVLTLTVYYELSFSQIKSSGNGLSVERKFYKEVAKNNKMVYEELKEGEALKVGQKIRVEYQMQSDENRSFGRLVAYREASLVPVNQLSGLYGISLKPINFDSWYITPMGYREVKENRSIIYLDVIPENDFSISEEFFVTRAGVFKAPVVEMECLYANHYRANGNYLGNMIVE